MTTRPDCGELELALWAYVDHEASPHELAQVEAHVETCAACAQRLHDAQQLATRLDGDLRQLLAQAPTQLAWRPPAMAGGGSARWRAARPPRRGVWLAIAIVAGLLACLALLRAVGPVVVSSTAPEPSAPPTAVVASAPAASAARVLVARLDGTVDPAEAAYVQRVLGLAQTQHAAAVVLVLQVRGGLNAPLAAIQQAVDDSAVPVLSYLPAGSGADAVALRLAGSSALEGAAPSVAGADPAAEVVAPDLGGLLRGADGRSVQTAAGAVRLETGGAAAETVEMEPLELLGHRLLDPTTAYLLFVLGLYAVFVEVAHPGALVPGLVGLASLIVAAGAFAAIGVNPLGVLLLLLAVGLMAVDTRALGHGALTLVGVGCLVVGSLLLYTHWGGGAPPEVAIAPLAVVGVAGAGLALGLGLVHVARGVQRLPAAFGTEPVIGARGVLAPEGVVQVNGQLWSARLTGGRLDAGQAVRVRARHGLVLEVEPATSPGAATQKGASR